MPNGITKETFEGLESVDDKLSILFDIVMEIRAHVKTYVKIWGLIGGVIPPAIFLLFLIAKYWIS